MVAVLVSMILSVTAIVGLGKGISGEEYSTRLINKPTMRSITRFFKAPSSTAYILEIE